jgi:hypothetical protein
MSTVTLTGKDTIVIDSRILADFADGDTCNIEFPNDLATEKAGKNGNMIYAYNAAGNIANVTLRVLRGSGDDKYLQSRLQEYINDPAAFVMVEGEFIKRLGDGAGNVVSDTITLPGGAFKKKPGAKENVAGDTEQAVSVYALVFANSQRAIG